MKRETYKRQLQEYLTEMGIYRNQYEYLIDSLALTLEMRDRNMEEWKKMGYVQVMEYTNKGGNTNLAKVPYFDNHIKYTDQVMKYMKTIGLTPIDANRLGLAMTEDEDDDELLKGI